MSAIVTAVLISLLGADRAEADRLFAEARWPEARAVYEELLAEAEGDSVRADLLDRIGVSLFVEGEFWEAESRFSQSLALVDTARTRLHRGKTYFHAGRNSAQRPGVVGAEVLALMNDAVRDLSRCLDLDAGSGEAWLFVGYCEYFRRDPEAGMRAYKKALELMPGHPDAALQLGLLLEQDGRVGEARRVLSEVAGARRTLEHLMASGRLAGKDGDSLEMRQRYLEAALLSPSSEGPYYKLWDIARKRKQYREFERDMRTILDRHKGVWLPHYYLGFCHVNLKEPRKAIAEFEVVLRHKPDWQDPRYRIAQIRRIDLGDEAGAIPIYLEVLEKDPGYADALRVVSSLAHIRVLENDLVTARRLLVALVQTEPSEPLHVLNLTVVEKERGEPEAALALYVDGEKRFPFDPRLPNDRGLLLMGLGRESEALDAFREALDRDPDHLDTLENMGAYARLRGEPKAATEYFRRAYELTRHRVEDAARFRRYLDMVSREPAGSGSR